MILKLDIEVKRLSIEQANECDKDTLCFDFGRIIGGTTQMEAGQVKYTPSSFVESENVQDAITELGDKTNEEINKLLPLIYAGL